jgi:hypothetical protein
MSNGDTPASPTPAPSGGDDKPKGCLALLGSLSGTTKIHVLGMDFEAPLGVGLTVVLGLVAAYVLLLAWVVPKRVPVLSEPLIDAALTAQPTPTAVPPLPRLVVSKKIIQNTQFCVEPGERVYLRIEPTPDPAKIKYFVDDLGTANDLERSDSELDFTVEDKKPGDLITLILYEVDERGALGRPLSDARFSVQEVCK